MAKDYAARATATGRALGLGPVEIIEVESRKPGKAAEAEVLAAQIAALGPSWLAVCDEHGTARRSRDFAAHIAKLRDDGHRRLIILIGGADGLDPSLMATAREKLAFGIQTWPHALARGHAGVGVGGFAGWLVGVQLAQKSADRANGTGLGHCRFEFA